MTRKEYETLDADHPEWVELTYDQIRQRFWAYDINVVRLARAEAHWQKALVATFGPLVTWLSNKLGGIA